MKRYLPVLLGLSLLASTTACRLIKGSITGRVMIMAGSKPFPANFFMVRLVDASGDVLATTSTDTSGYFRFRTRGPKGNDIVLKVPWGEYTLRVYKPALGNSADSKMVLEEKVVLRKGVGKYDLEVRSEDVM